MKKGHYGLLLAAVMMVGAIFLSSYTQAENDSDSNSTSNQNHIFYNGRKYNLSYGLYSSQYLPQIDTYSTTLLIESPLDDCGISEGGLSTLNLILASRGIRSFREGVFVWVPRGDTSENDFLFHGMNMVDIPKNRPSPIPCDDSGASRPGESGRVVSGSVTVLGTPPAAQIEFDLQLEDGSRAKGQFSGPWTHMDEILD